jgi:hypothetical protein
LGGPYGWDLRCATIFAFGGPLKDELLQRSRGRLRISSC